MSEEKKRRISPYLLSLSLFERLRESSDRCFLFVNGEITYFFTSSYEEWKGWTVLLETKNLFPGFIENEDGKFKNGFYKADEKGFVRKFLYWSKMADDDGNKKAGIRLSGIKTDLKLLQHHKWQRFFLEIVPIENKINRSFLYSIDNVKEILYLSEMHCVQSLVPCYFGKERRYIDLDIFLFLCGYSIDNYSCWISEDYNLPLIFRESDDINSQVIALFYPIRL